MGIDKKQIGFFVLMLVGFVAASAYEWFYSPYEQTSGTFIHNNGDNSNKLYRYVETSAAYDEYVAFYLYSNSTWQRITECDYHQVINGQKQIGCFDIPFWGFSAGTYSARVTVNYAGCGTYTPNPTPSCGDIRSFNLTLS